MRKAILATVTAGVLLAGTGVAVAADTGSGAATCTPPTMLTSAQATDAALRAAGGGRVAGMQVVQEAGRMLYVVSFVRGTRVRTATVDAVSGEVTSIINGQPGDTGGGGQTGNGSGAADTNDDDSDDSGEDDGGEDDGGEDDDDDDGGPVREGVEGNK